MLRWPPILAKVQPHHRVQIDPRDMNLSFSLPGALGICTALSIRPIPCSNAVGDRGRCMFVWECIKTEGRHLGTCSDRFLFGTCCGHNDSSNAVVGNDLPTSSARPGLPSFTVTSPSLHLGPLKSSSLRPPYFWFQATQVTDSPHFQHRTPPATPETLPFHSHAHNNKSPAQIEHSHPY
ncbi:hypothetical protein LAZ67_22001800 [Cordylochernes scorpioides]|uniref:Serine proteinase stubble n=1 Tax=Cordylochernes scorpioides TaxID=51811 RepID=A0ABY6LT53_9ARAC|nr:hypothetical protein LAZ67_22001800 [Cordylochernes scorpioides]